MFADAIDARRSDLVGAIAGRRVLVVGAAGSIGQAFVHQLVAFGPAALHLVDLSENALVELVRDLRSSDDALPAEFETFAIDFGSSGFDHLVRTRGPYDTFVNFAALKHVRSERNVESLMRMIDTNVGYLHRYLGSSEASGHEQIFSVSTDKTVSPSSLMGATKNLMEKTLFADHVAGKASTARFANVAFSDGSLLHGFGLRLAKRQPLAAPTGVRRYFISHEEAGQLCLLACFLGEQRQVFFPALEPDRDLVELPELARRFLAFHGLRPIECGSEAEAKSRVNGHSGEWPCFFSASDTSGEKPYEEFYRQSDHPDFSAYASIGVLHESSVARRVIDGFLAELDGIKRQARWSKEAVIAAIERAVPELDHVEFHRNLDQKM